MGEMKKYDSYKDSGVEWIEEIPSHWEVKSFRFCIDVLTDYTANGSFASLAENVTYFERGYSRLVRLTDLRVNLENEGLYVDEHAHNFLKKSELFGGELLIANVGAYAGLVMQMPVSEGKFTLGPNMFLVRLNQNNNFFLSQLNASFCSEQLKIMAISSAQPKLNKENIRQLKVVTPPIEEQTAIANYLDQKTTQIDDLIAKKERLIELLEEERTAIINQAVTKGLDPNVPMKDSGIEWLGEIPAHWELKRIRFVFEIIKRIAGELGHEVLSVTQQGIKVKDITSGAGQLSMDYSKYQLVDIGDFVMNHMDLLTGYVDKSKYQGVTSPDYRVFRALDKMGDSEFFLYFFQMCYRNKIFFPLGQGSAQAGRWRLPTNQFRDFLIPVPPFDEQKIIVDILQKKLKSIDKSQEFLRREIELIKEYKTALISEVVTGKVDVRKEKLN